MLEATPFTSKGVTTELSSFREKFIFVILNIDLAMYCILQVGIMTSVCISVIGGVGSLLSEVPQFS